MLTQLHPDTGQLHWALIIFIRGIKDTEGRYKKVPTTIASRYPTSYPRGCDLTCPYFAILRL